MTGSTVLEACGLTRRYGRNSGPARAVDEGAFADDSRLAAYGWGR